MSSGDLCKTSKNIQDLRNSMFCASLNVAKGACMLMLRCYQLTVGLVLPPACRFQPSCSSYFKDAVELHGIGKGTYLGLKRLLKCHPWGSAGYDPVPHDKQGVRNHD